MTQQQPSHGPQARKKRHGCLYSILGAFGLLILIIIIVTVSNSGGGNSGPSTASSHAPAAASPSPSKTTAAKKTAGIGTPVRDGKFQFTVTSVSHAKSVGDTQDGLGDTAQGEYTILHVTVTNIGNQSQTLDDSAQYVYDSSGRKYDASSDADIDLAGPNNSGSTWFDNINPGNTVHGELAFDMPASARTVKAELHDSVFSGGVTVSLR